LYLCIHGVVVSDGISSVKIAACVVDPFNYTLVVAIYHYFSLALEYYWIQS